MTKSPIMTLEILIVGNANRRNALNDYDSHFKIAFSLRDNSGLCKPLLNSELRLMAYFEICSCLTNLFNNFR